MKISLFQGVLIGVFGVIALIGLFVFATYTGQSNGNDAVGTVVVWGTLPMDEMQGVLTLSAKTDTALKNVSYVEKNAATLPGDLAAAIATGTGPDLVLASQEEFLTIRGFILPIPSSTLSASAFANTFIEEGQLFAAKDGYYGIPFLVDPLVLFSNRAILSSSGIVKPPATWEALTGLVPNVAVLSPSRQISRGLIALGSYDNVHNARAILSSLFLQTGTPLSIYGQSGTLSADLGEKSTVNRGTPPGESVLNFYTQFADPSKISYTWNSALKNSRQAFIAGELALYLGYASEAHFLAAANPNLDFITSPLPQPATANTKAAYGLIYALMIPNGTKNASGAYQAAALLTNPIEQNAAASATGLAPAVLSELATTTLPSQTAGVAYGEALYAKGWMSPMPTNTDIVFSRMIEDVVSGRSTLSVALTFAEHSLNELFK